MSGYERLLAKLDAVVEQIDDSRAYNRATVRIMFLTTLGMAVVFVISVFAVTWNIR